MTDSAVDSSAYAALFAPIKFSNGVQSRNRIALAPMTHYSSDDDGHSIPDEAPYFVRRCKGVGVAFSPAYAVSLNGRAYFGEPYMTDDSFLPDLTTIAAAMKSGGALAVIQLHHGGCVAPAEVVPNGDVVGPSAIPTPGRSTAQPRELTAAEIDQIIDDFGQATLRSIKAGFDGIVLHGAYGYLLQQFISPYTNRREDKWGGTQEKRFAFPLALLDEVKRVVAKHATPSFLVGYRFTPEEALNPGLTMADALAFTEALAQKDLHFIDVLVNDYRSRPRVGVEDLKSRRLALIKKQIAGRAVLMGGGSIFTADDAVDALHTGVDMCTLARAMIIDPEWVEKVRQGKEKELVGKLDKDARVALELPEKFWKVIWSLPGWFPGTEPVKTS